MEFIDEILPVWAILFFYFTLHHIITYVVRGEYLFKYKSRLDPSLKHIYDSFLNYLFSWKMKRMFGNKIIPGILNPFIGGSQFEEKDLTNEVLRKIRKLQFHFKLSLIGLIVLTFCFFMLIFLHNMFLTS
jgi:hypothetical protein